MATDSAEEIIQTWAGVVRRYARRAYTSSATLDVEDLEQVGRMAAIRAVETYDPSFGTKLSSYVTRLVRQAIYNEAGRFCGLFTVAHTVTSLGAEIHRLSVDGHTDDEIAEIMSQRKNKMFDVDMVLDLRSVYEKRYSAPFDASSPGVEDDSPFEQNITRVLEGSIKTQMDRAIVAQRWLADGGVDEIAEQFGVSSGTVRRAERRLRERVEAAIREIVE